MYFRGNPVDPLRPQGGAGLFGYGVVGRYAALTSSGTVNEGRHMQGDMKIKSPGEYAYEELMTHIKEFQDTLAADVETGIDAAGGTGTIHVDGVGTDGLLIVFVGVDDQGRPTRLIQHHSQINVQVVAVKKLDPNARRIGF